MNTTFPAYIKNPSIVGKTNSQIKLITANYRSRWDAIVVRESGLLTYWLYEDEKENYYLYAKIPSEVVPKFYYDVIIKFISTKLTKFAPSLKSYNIQVFSNDPAFAYTYAYAFNKHGLFLDDFSSKMGTDFLKNKALDRNPKTTISYIKSLYFTYFLMQDKDLFTKDKWRKHIKYNAKSIIRGVMLTENKIKLRQRLYEQMKLKQASENPTPVKPRNKFAPSAHVKAAPQSKPIRPIRNTKIISNMSRGVKMVKKTSRFKK